MDLMKYLNASREAAESAWFMFSFCDTDQSKVNGVRDDTKTMLATIRPAEEVCPAEGCAGVT